VSVGEINVNEVIPANESLHRLVKDIAASEPNRLVRRYSARLILRASCRIRRRRGDGE
jgi:hypothetical protein